MDIINIGFVNTFPDAVLGWPGTNFGNQCDGTLFPESELLSGCHQIWEDIPVCKAMGKTVMLSIGGAYTTNEVILSDEIATWFANFLWYSFGPYQPGETFFPRPFQNASVDGFDFDIEHNGGAGMFASIDMFPYISAILTWTQDMPP
jgi:chitinase